MLDPDLLDILVCPETRQPVRPASDQVLAEVNRAIEAGTLLTQSGGVPEGPLDAALLREDGRLLYPVRDDIPIMLVDQAIELDPKADE
jgi:uncharacterized protein YbaR (Trm112 family)